MGHYRPDRVRFMVYFTYEEEDLIAFAMKCTGLNKTKTIRAMIRRGIIDEIIKYRLTGVPKLPDNLRHLVEDY